MKRTFRIALMLTTALAVAPAPAAWAACAGIDTEPVFHGFGGFIANCPDAQPVAGYLYSLASPATINSASQGFVCNVGGILNGTLLACQPEAGVAGDNQVTVYYEFGSGNTGSVGCPVPDLITATNGQTPLMVQVVCNNGASALIQLGFWADVQQYLLELSAPDDGSPVMASFGNGPILSSVSAGPSPSASNVCVNVPAPTFYSDCNTAGGQGTSCLNGGPSRAAVSRGRLYTRNAPCNAPPSGSTTGWALLTNQPDAAGAACNSITRPTAPGECAWVGATAFVGGTTETGGLVGYFKVATEAAANDKVKIDRAGYAQGKVIVDFSTTNETSIIGFNVYSDATKLNGNLITSDGAGNHAYTFEVGRGALKGGKSVLVEAVKSDGTVEKTAPVALK